MWCYLLPQCVDDYCCSHPIFKYSLYNLLIFDFSWAQKFDYRILFVRCKLVKTHKQNTSISMDKGANHLCVNIFLITCKALKSAKIILHNNETKFSGEVKSIDNKNTILQLSKGIFKVQ